MTRTTMMWAFFVLAVALGTIALFAGSAFAAGNPLYGTEDNPVQVFITQTMDMSEGVKPPYVDFSYSANLRSINGEYAYGGEPQIGPWSLSITPYSSIDNQNGVATVWERTNNILAGVNWPAPGIYEYEIVANFPNLISIEYQAFDWEYANWTAENYMLTVYVKNGANGLYAASAVIERNGQKHDDISVWSLYFPLSKIHIEKTVEGPYADLARRFPFEITMTASALAQAPYYIGDATPLGPTYYNADVYVNLGSASQQLVRSYSIEAFGTSRFELAHNETLVIGGVLAGATATVLEDGSPGYTARITYDDGFSSGGYGPYSQGDGIGTSELNMLEEFVYVTFINEETATGTPAGLALRNAPYVASIIVAGAAIIALTASRRRRADIS